MYNGGKRKQYPPIFCIEGSDGSGKSVQSELLKQTLQQRGKRVAMIDFPQYQSFFGMEIGKMLSGESEKFRADQIDVKSMCLWYAADRLCMLKNFDFSSFDCVIFNRYTLSNIVYQTARQPQTEREKLADWIYELEHVQFSLPVPDLYLFLDVTLDSSEKNVACKGFREYVGEKADVYESSRDLQQVVRKLYRSYAKKYDNIRVLDCMEISGVMCTQENIAARILEILEAEGLLG